MLAPGKILIKISKRFGFKIFRVYNHKHRNQKILIRGKGPKAFHDAEIVGEAAVYAGPFIFFTNITCLVHLLLNLLFVLSQLSGSGTDFQKFS